MTSSSGAECDPSRKYVRTVNDATVFAFNLSPEKSECMPSNEHDGDE